jgi:LysR family transcriptional regulator (chromosome initiation inhibitor)
MEQVRALEKRFEQTASPAASPFTTLSIATNSELLSIGFIESVAEVCDKERIVLDILIEDEKKTAKLLQETKVVGCVTSQPEALSGCKSHRLGDLRYRFVCSPQFKKKYFSKGLTRQALRESPTGVFGVFDQVHEDFLQRIFPGFHQNELPRHLIRSPEALAKLALCNLACLVLLEPVVQPYLRSGELVDLAPGKVFRIPLYWQHYAAPHVVLESFSNVLVKKVQALLKA